MRADLRKIRRNEREDHLLHRRQKILIVDDNPENLMVTRSLLKRTAVFVDTAASGEECVHKVRQNIYDLILLDYMMPQMDGIDTIRELKKRCTISYSSDRFNC